MAEPLLRVNDLVKYFVIKGGVFSREMERVHAVNGVSFEVEAGETLGLVGESGCGKSTTGRCILRLIEPTSGEVWFDGRNVTTLDAKSLRTNCREMQIIFQDPYASLNPRMTVGSIIGEALVIHKLAPNRRAREERVVQLLETVGLSADHLRRYPHEFSGGQRQRIAIARALAADPSVIVLDEPLASLDASAQAQLANLLVRLSRELDLGLLLISHDLAIVRHVADDVSVMYLGRMVETAPTGELWEQPAHPYTEALIAAVPRADGAGILPASLPGEVPNPAHPPSGCRFHPRCPYAFERCPVEEPPLLTLTTVRAAACWLQSPGVPPRPLANLEEPQHVE